MTVGSREGFRCRCPSREPKAAEEEGVPGLADARDHSALGCRRRRSTCSPTAAKKAEFLSDRGLSALEATEQGRLLMHRS